ncbi:hypothetical protein EB093_09845, partial [bacterium]|nr:hypothetical protein [bacterium]
MTANGVKWLTVPVIDDGQKTPIQYKAIARDVPWRRPLLNAIHHAYATSPGYDLFFPTIQELISRDWTNIADLAIASIDLGFRLLGKTLVSSRASELDVDASDA